MPPPKAAAGGLVVCPTPIGNLEDVTIRTLERLRGADVIACEDTRHTRRLLQRHGIEARLTSLHEHNERARARALVARMREGERVALVSDAGTPLVSDPGYALVRATIDAGLELEVLPGASAVLTALVASGLPPQRWLFAGFLPRRRAELEELLGEARDTLVAFESPRRLGATLAVLAELDPERPACVCRELTKLHEEVVRGSAAELARRYLGSAPRGEIVLVIGAPTAPARHDTGAALAAAEELRAAGARPRSAAGVVSRLTGVPANELYRGLTRSEQ